MSTYTVIDIETTGLSSDADHIIEIAAVRLQDGCETEQFHSLVDPGIFINPRITDLTGITNETVCGAPQIEEVIDRFQGFLGDDIFVAHNAAFDSRFIACNYQRYLCTELMNPLLCTCKLARRVLPDLRSHKLTSLAACFEIRNPQAHRALADAMTTAKILAKMLQILSAYGIDDAESILKFQSLPKRKAERLLAHT